MTHLDDLCRRRPDEPRYATARLHALARLGRQPEVLAGVGALEAAGTRSAALDLLAAAALAADGRHPEVLERFAAATRHDPGDPAVHQVAGDYHLARGDRDAAAAAYAAALARDPDQAMVHSGLAQVALERGDHALAAEHALASLREVFYQPLTQLRLGRALMVLGARAEAQRAFEHALEQAPGFGEAHLHLAALREAAGDPLGASEHRQRALGLRPASRAG